MATRSHGDRRGVSTSSAPSSSTCPPSGGGALIRHLLRDVVAPGGRLILCGYGSPRSAVPPDPVHAIVLSYGLEAELALDVVAPEGGGAILELAVLRAG